MTLAVRKTGDGLIIRVKASPNAGKSTLSGIHNGALKIKIGAQPDKGKANKELVGFLSAAFGLKKSDIEIVRGGASRDKEILIKNIDENEIRRIINGKES